MTRTKAVCRALTALLAPVLALSLSGCTGQEGLDGALGAAGEALSSATSVVGGALSGAATVIGGAADKVESMFAGPSIEEALESQRSANATLTEPTIHTAGVLTVGLESSETAPMCITSEDGSFEGYDVDVAYAIADQLGLTVEFVSVPDAAHSTDSGCDIVMGAEAGSAGDMTVVGSYAESATAFFHRGEEVTVTRDELTGATVGVQAGSLSQQLLKRSDLEVATQTFENLNEAFEALEQGGVDYVLCDAYSGAYLQGAYNDIALAGTLDVPSSVGVAVDSANAELQQSVQAAVDKIGSGGVVSVIRSKWLGGMSTLGGDSQVQGITISAGSTTGTTGETTEVVDGGSGAQDGSTAGANAADIAG